MTLPFSAYSGQVWAVINASFQYFIQQLELATNPGTLVPLAETVFTTAQYGLDAINARRIYIGLSNELTYLNQMIALPISISPTDYPYVINRIGSLNAAVSSLAAIIPSVSLTPVGPSLDQNDPPLDDPNSILWLIGFDFEVPPVGLDTVNLSSNAQAVVTAFYNLAGAIAALQGNQLNSLYDSALRMSETAQLAANTIGDYYSGSINITGTSPNDALTVWNQMLVLPAFLNDAFLLNSSPYTEEIQQDAVIRYLIITISYQLALFLLVMRKPVTTQINQAVLMVGDSLMDFANRNTGNFENWTEIATLNNLYPPYVGPTSVPGIAGWGTMLLLPTPGSASSAIGVTPSYANNYLGIDQYTGPINGSMPSWTGDYQTIAGYANFRWALGRRIQTTLGNLIYHSDYGCRIPPEVGNIQDANTVGQIAAFGKSAILNDPRVAQVLLAKAASLPNFAVAFEALVQPGGFGSTSISVNEVISPNTSPQEDAT